MATIDRHEMNKPGLQTGQLGLMKQKGSGLRMWGAGREEGKASPVSYSRFTICEKRDWR